MVLDNVGVSRKLLQIVKVLFDNAVMLISDKSSSSIETPVPEGILQREVLSPALFSLYTYNIVQIFNDSLGIPYTKIEI